MNPLYPALKLTIVQFPVSLFRRILAYSVSMAPAAKEKVICLGVDLAKVLYSPVLKPVLAAAVF